MYGRFDTLILDDVFSALDADTEARVFRTLLGDGGLLHGQSVILATNQVYRLPSASYITMLHLGRPVEQGSYGELLAANGPMALLVQEFAAGTTHTKEAKVVDALAEAAEKEKSIREADADRDQEQGATGSVKWSTYLLYLRGMGLWYAAMCRSGSMRPLIRRDRLRGGHCGDLTRCRHLSPGLDLEASRVVEIPVRRLPGRLQRDASRIAHLVLHRDLQRLRLFTPGDE